MFPLSWAILVTNVWDPSAWGRDPNNKIFIIDEAEEVIENNLLGLNGSGFSGLASLRHKRVVCFSATLSPYFRQVFLRAFGLPADAI